MKRRGEGKEERKKEKGGRKERGGGGKGRGKQKKQHSNSGHNLPHNSLPSITAGQSLHAPTVLPT